MLSLVNRVIRNSEISQEKSWSYFWTFINDDNYFIVIKIKIRTLKPKSKIMSTMELKRDGKRNSAKLYKNVTRLLSYQFYLFFELL